MCEKKKDREGDIYIYIKREREREREREIIQRPLVIYYEFIFALF